MTYYDKRNSSGKLKVFSLIGAGLIAATAISKLVYMILNNEFSSAEIWGIIGILVAGGIILAENRLECMRVYKEEENNTVLPEGERYEMW